jgi:hypothetical protein
MLLRVLAAPGQAFLNTVLRIFDKPSNQDVVNLALDAVAELLQLPARPDGRVDATLDDACATRPATWLETDERVRRRWARSTCLRCQLTMLRRAARACRGLSYGVVQPGIRRQHGDRQPDAPQKLVQPVAEPLRGDLESRCRPD